MAYSSEISRSDIVMPREPAGPEVSIDHLVAMGLPVLDQGVSLGNVLVNSQTAFDLSPQQLHHFAEGLALAHPAAANDYLTLMINSGQYDSSATLGFLQRMIETGAVSVNALPASAVDLIFSQLAQQDEAETRHIQLEQKIALLIQWIKLCRQAISDMVDEDAAALEAEAARLREQMALDAAALRQQAREFSQAQLQSQDAESADELDVTPTPTPVPRRSLLDDLTDAEIVELLSSHEDWSKQAITVDQFRQGRQSVLHALTGQGQWSLGGQVDRETLLAHHQALADANAAVASAEIRLTRAQSLGWSTVSYERAHEEAQRRAEEAQQRLAALEQRNADAFIVRQEQDQLMPTPPEPKPGREMTLEQLIQAGLDGDADLSHSQRERFEQLQDACNTLDVDLAEFVEKGTDRDRRRMVTVGMREAIKDGVEGSAVTEAASVLREASRDLAVLPSPSPTPFMHISREEPKREQENDADMSGLSPLSMDPAARFGA